LVSSPTLELRFAEAWDCNRNNSRGALESNELQKHRK
jgi:hypothetical protein